MDVNELDPSVKPSDNFFAYVNGKWLKENPIPPEESHWGSFYKLRVTVEDQLKAILEELALKADIPAGDVAQKVRDFYITGIDNAKRNALGAQPIEELLARIEEAKDKAALSSLTAGLHKVGAWVFWTPFAEQDEKQSDMVALHAYQGGLGLPDRDYYVNDDEKSRAIRAGYAGYVAGLFGRIGVPLAQGEAVAKIVIDLETRLARSSRTRVELRDVHRQYNKMGADEIRGLIPGFSFGDYFAALGLPTPEYFIVGQPEFFSTLELVLAETPLDAIKLYCTAHLLSALATYLSDDFEKLRFDFYSRTFSGAKEMKPQWRRVLATLNELLDEAVGKLYVERYFDGDAKKKITVLVDRLVEAYRARIEKLDWMEDATKKRALEKLDMFSRKLGYPDIWRDIGALEIKDDSYADNYMRAHAFEFLRQMKKIGRPVDRAEWLMSPQTVNAYYQPPMNEIVFPAAILQPPFFDPKADDAYNYGGIGTVIGHELTHGFDDQGSLFNGKGNLEEWWTKGDRERFNARAKILVEQFDGYKPLPDVRVNGSLTLGENIADLGGLVVAYDALRLALGPEKMEVAAGGFKPTQKFFVQYAITERGAVREERLRLQIKADTHSPSEYRVNGPVSNMEEFYSAFGVKEGDVLWRPKELRARIW